MSEWSQFVLGLGFLVLIFSFPTDMQFGVERISKLRIAAKTIGYTALIFTITHIASGFDRIIHH